MTFGWHLQNAVEIGFLSTHNVSKAILAVTVAYRKLFHEAFLMHQWQPHHWTQCLWSHGMHQICGDLVSPTIINMPVFTNPNVHMLDFFSLIAD